MRLPDKIILMRKQNGWSQEELAEKLDVSRQAVSRWENGTALPDAQNVLQLSKLFHVTTDYLLNDDYESDGDIPLVQQARQETEEQIAKKKKRQLQNAIIYTVTSSIWLACAILNFGRNDIVFGLNLVCVLLNAGMAAYHYVLYSKKE